MLIAIHSLDKPDMTAMRDRYRPERMEYYARHKDRLVTAGPLLDPAGTQIGSFAIVAFPDLEAARAFHDEDPFVRAGLYAESRLHCYSPRLGSWRP
jgi:uncharacterized protein YciI